MNQKLKALAIDKSESQAQSLAGALGPEIEFESFEYTSSILNAIKSHEEEEFQICFISDSFPVDELRPFFEDVKGLNRDLTCVFVQVREKVEPGSNRLELKACGIDFIISRDGTQHDKEGIGEVVGKKLGNDEVKCRILDVSRAMDVLLNELDIAAENQKRGRTDHLQLNKIAMDFIEMQTAFDQEVLHRYYETLTQKSKNSNPSIAKRLDVPEEILSKELPELTATGYKGASHRVWQKLMQLHGVNDSEREDTRETTNQGNETQSE